MPPQVDARMATPCHGSNKLFMDDGDDMRRGFGFRFRARQTVGRALRCGSVLGILSLGVLPNGVQGGEMLRASAFPVAPFLGLTFPAQPAVAPTAPMPAAPLASSPTNSTGVSESTWGNPDSAPPTTETWSQPADLGPDSRLAAEDAISHQPLAATRAERSSREYHFDNGDEFEYESTSIMAFPPLVAPEQAVSGDGSMGAESMHTAPENRSAASAHVGLPVRDQRTEAAPLEQDDWFGDAGFETNRVEQRDVGTERTRLDAVHSRGMTSEDGSFQERHHESFEARDVSGVVRTEREPSFGTARGEQRGPSAGTQPPVNQSPYEAAETSRQHERGQQEGRNGGMSHEDTSAVPRLPDGAVQQARQYINAGIQQAERGAVYSARAQFIKVLRLVTQSFDAETQSNRYSTALAAGLRALEESNDFRPSGSQLEGNLNLVNILQTHQTPVLKQVDPASITPLSAARAYHAYAERQLAFAVGEELVAADAYYGLAKLQSHLDVGRPDRERHNGPIAMSYYQAALIAYPEHYLAANELGVMFARFGQLEDAREVLRFALTLHQESPELWLNLSRVHERLGESDLAERAHGEYQHAAQLASRSAPARGGRGGVEWMDPDSFARVGSEREMMLRTETAERVPPSGPASESSPSETATRKTSWGIWPFR